MNGPADTQRRLTLPPEPLSVGRAREAVRELLEQLGLDFVDEATLLVSEVVTNAVLHAATPIEVSCEVETGSVCVEVRDRSPVLPGPRRYDTDAMTGRGLALVELLASDWGIDPDPGTGGKTVWFRLASAGLAPSDLPARPGPAAKPEAGERFVLRLRNVPASLLATTVQYGDTLLRELTLASLSGGPPDGSWSWHGSKIDLGPILDAVHHAARGAAESADVEIPVPVGAGAAAFERLALIEEADRLAHEGSLLTVPELPEVAACRRWFLREIGSQAAGGAPVAWELPGPLEPARSVLQLPDEERERLDGLGTAAVVADDANRIIYANAEAVRLLGWEEEGLAGRRLISIVPRRLRESHLAGFGRYLLTRERRLLGRRVLVPALHRDGTEIDVLITITTLDLNLGQDGPLAFLAVFTEAGGRD